MSFERIPIGPYERFYVGLWDDNTDELTEVLFLNTDTNELIDQTPFTYFKGIGKNLQSGPRTVTVSLSFYSDDILFFNLTGGNDLDETEKGLVSGANFYSLLLLFPDDTDNTVYIPRARVDSVRRLPRSKDQATAFSITFIAESPNRFVNEIPHPDRDYEPVVVYDTPDNIDTLLSTRSPL